MIFGCPNALHGSGVPSALLAIADRLVARRCGTGATGGRHLTGMELGLAWVPSEVPVELDPESIAAVDQEFRPQLARWRQTRRRPCVADGGARLLPLPVVQLSVSPVATRRFAATSAC